MTSALIFGKPRMFRIPACTGWGENDRALLSFPIESPPIVFSATESVEFLRSEVSNPRPNRNPVDPCLRGEGNSSNGFHSLESLRFPSRNTRYIYIKII